MNLFVRIIIWGVSIQVLGKIVDLTESSTFLFDLVSGVGSITPWSTLLRYKEP